MATVHNSITYVLSLDPQPSLYIDINQRVGLVIFQPTVMANGALFKFRVEVHDYILGGTRNSEIRISSSDECSAVNACVACMDTMHQTKFREVNLGRIYDLP